MYPNRFVSTIHKGTSKFSVRVFFSLPQRIDALIPAMMGAEITAYRGMLRALSTPKAVQAARSMPDIIQSPPSRLLQESLLVKDDNRPGNHLLWFHSRSRQDPRGSSVISHQVMDCWW